MAAPADTRAPPALARAVGWSALLLAAAALAAGFLLDDPAEWIADRIAPYPILVLAVVTLALMVLARLRGPAPAPFSTRRERFFWAARFAFAAAAAILLLVWIGPWAAGLGVARYMFQAVLLVIVTGLVLGLAGAAVANFLRVIGRAG